MGFEDRFLRLEFKVRVSFWFFWRVRDIMAFRKKCGVDFSFGLRMYLINVFEFFIGSMKVNMI